jgi:hypothetical protein
MLIIPYIPVQARLGKKWSNYIHFGYINLDLERIEKYKNDKAQPFII